MAGLKDISKLTVVSVRAVNVNSQEEADAMFANLSRITGSDLKPTHKPHFKGEDEDIYDLVEADRELQGRAHIDDPYEFDESHTDVCSNCGAYHARTSNRCAQCDNL